MLSDGELLRQYLDDGSEPAFTELVQRHLNVVYRAALRRVGGNAHAADDVTQRVFAALARKAGALRSHASLAGWLYTSTRFAAAELVRGEQRRRKYEQEAHTMNELTFSPPISAEQLEPLLDEIMERLPERDREAVILHFFEQRSFVEIAAMIASSADATRMRVNRALDRMRVELERRGMASTSAALGAALTAQSVTATTLPEAATVAARVIVGVAGNPGVGLSIASRVLTTTGRSWGFVASAAIAVMLGALAVYHIVASRPLTHVGSPPAVSTMPAADVGDHALSADSIAVPSQKSVATTPNVSAPVGGRLGFSELSVEERNILAILWRNEQVEFGSTRFGFGIGDKAPNAPGVDPLLELGYVAEVWTQRPGFRVVHLTPAGRKFCANQQKELEAYEPTRARRKVVTGKSSK